MAKIICILKFQFHDLKVHPSIYPFIIPSNSPNKPENLPICSIGNNTCISDPKLIGSHVLMCLVMTS